MCHLSTLMQNILTVTGWLSGKEALFMESLTEEEIGADCVAVLKRLLKRDVPAPVRVIR